MKSRLSSAWSHAQCEDLAAFQLSCQNDVNAGVAGLASYCGLSAVFAAGHE